MVIAAVQEAVTRLRHQRVQVWEMARALAQAAATEDRCFTRDEQRKWRTYQSAMKILDERIGKSLGK